MWKRPTAYSNSSDKVVVVVTTFVIFVIFLLIITIVIIAIVVIAIVVIAIDSLTQLSVVVVRSLGAMQDLHKALTEQFNNYEKSRSHRVLFTHRPEDDIPPTCMIRCIVQCIVPCMIQ